MSSCSLEHLTQKVVYKQRDVNVLSAKNRQHGIIKEKKASQEIWNKVKKKVSHPLSHDFVYHESLSCFVKCRNWRVEDVHSRRRSMARSHTSVETNHYGRNTDSPTLYHKRVKILFLFPPSHMQAEHLQARRRRAASIIMPSAIIHGGRARAKPFSI